MACGDFPPPENITWIDARGYVPNASFGYPVKYLGHIELQPVRRARVLLRVRFKHDHLMIRLSRPYEGERLPSRVIAHLGHIGDPFGYQTDTASEFPQQWRQTLINVGPWT